jgi:hypothetical protein
MWTTCRQHRALSSEIHAGQGHQLVYDLAVQVQSPGSTEVRAPYSGHFIQLSRCVASLKNRGDVKSLVGCRSGEGCTAMDTTMVSIFRWEPVCRVNHRARAGVLSIWPHLIAKQAMLLLRNLGTETAVGAV